MVDYQGLGQKQNDKLKAQFVAYRGQVHGPVEDEGGGGVRAPVVRQFARDISNGKSIFVYARGKEEPKVSNMMEPKGVSMVKVVPMCKFKSVMRVTNSMMFQGKEGWPRCVVRKAA